MRNPSERYFFGRPTRGMPAIVSFASSVRTSRTPSAKAFIFPRAAVRERGIMPQSVHG